jgi:hypothetical protein
MDTPEILWVIRLPPHIVMLIKHLLFNIFLGLSIMNTTTIGADLAKGITFFGLK